MKTRKRKPAELGYEVIDSSHTHSWRPGEKEKGQYWDSTTFGPMFNRKTEGSFVDTCNSLLAIPSFRQQLQKLRQSMLSEPERDRDWSVGLLCDEFEIKGGEEWIKWLIRNWDPSTSAPPPFNSELRPRNFYPWTIELQSQGEDRTGPKIPHRAVLTLNAGVSSREAERAAAHAVDLLSSSRVIKRGRPGLTEIERRMLHAEFENYGIPQPQLQLAVIRKIVHIMEKHNRPISQTRVGNEYRSWLKEKGHPVRRYAVEKRKRQA